MIYDQHCIYCGDPAVVMDHLVPYSVTGMVPGAARKGGSDSGECAPACFDCNTILGDRVYPSIEARRGYVLGKLRRRRGNSPEWSLEELDELGPSLRSAVAASIRADAALLARIAYAEGP